MTTDHTPAGVPSTDGMPMLGVGTWQNTDPQQCADSVATALEMGYRHVDTAQAYDNERAVGRGIERAGVDREDVFLATKVWTDSLAYEDVLDTAQGSLDRLGVDYVDLLYVHWPAGAYDPEDTLAAFDELHDRGLIEHVGVSNFTPDHVERARAELDAPLFANQVEMHPLLPQRELRAFATETDLNLVAYSPLARGDVFEVEQLSTIADAHGVSEAQVSLAWLREKGVTAIPKATSERHLRDNFESVELTLTDEEIERIDAIDTERRLVHPDFAPDSW